MPIYDLPVVPAADLAVHARAEDCWIAVEGVVYDATPILPEHPGGEALRAACGTDATLAFQTRPMGSGTPHSAWARAALARQVVGVLDGVARRARLSADDRAHVRRVGILPAVHRTDRGDVDLELHHAFGAETNVWLGLVHGLPAGLDISFGHATRTGESDLALRWGAEGPLLAAGLSAGGGYRYQGVPEGHGAGVFAEAAVELSPTPWLTLGLTPAIAALPAAQGQLAAEAGLTLALRPLPVLSLYAEGREDLRRLDPPDWGAGLRLHTLAHSFHLGAHSSAALAPLERLAADEGAFSVHLGLTRTF